MKKWMSIQGVVLLLALSVAAQTPITWVDTKDAAYYSRTNQVNIVLKEGSGPSSNRIDHFYTPCYIEGRISTPKTTMEDFIADAAYRVEAGTDMQVRGNSRTNSAGAYLSEHALTRHVFARYTPFTKVWELDSLRLDWPVYTKSLQKDLLDSALLNVGGEWGMADHLQGFPGAGAAGRWPHAKITSTPYVPEAGGSSWAWVHEGTHAHHRLGHAGNMRELKENDIDGEGVGLTRNATFEPTGSLFGAWHGFRGKEAYDATSVYKGVPGLQTLSFDKDLYDGYVDVNADNANYSENRTDSIIYDYYKAIDPIDSYTINDSVLTNPSVLAVNVASTNVIMIRWYVNGTEVVAQRGQEQLNVSALDLASGQYRITAEAYDSIIDYAFTGNLDLDLVRHNFECFMEKVGWMVDITTGGANDYLANATLTLVGDGAFSAGNFNTGLSGKVAVLAQNSGTDLLAASSGLSMAGLRTEGDYIVSGGNMTLTLGALHSLPNSASRVDSDIIFSTDLVKTGIGEMALGGDNTLNSGQIDVQEGTLVATSDLAFGSNTALTIRRGAEVKLNAGVALGATSMEGYSALWCNTGTERASVTNLSILRMGNSTIGHQIHGYLKLGSGTLALEGTTTLNHSVLLLTGANPSKVFDQINEDDLNQMRSHWMTDMGRGATYEIHDVTGDGSMVCKHGGQVRVLGNANFGGLNSDTNYLDGLVSVIYETRLTVEPSGQLSASVIDLGPWSTFEYNGATPLNSTFMQAHQERQGRTYIWSFPGLHGRLCGTGDIGTKVALRSNATVAPGAFGEVGRQNYLAGMFVDNVGTYEWQLGDTAAGNDGDGIPLGWDCIKVTGEFDLNGVVPPWYKNGSPKYEPIDEVVLMTLKVSDLNQSFASMNFDPFQEQNFLILEADSITGFSTNKFVVEVDPASTLGSAEGQWTVSKNSNQLFLNYAPFIAEPTTFMVTDGSLAVATNWDNGLPVGGIKGRVGLNATIPSKLTDFDLLIQSGDIIRNQNTVYEWVDDTDVRIEGGHLNYTTSVPAGTTHRVLRLKDTSSLTMAGGQFTLWDNRNIEIFNSGAILMQGGTLNAGGISLDVSQAGGAFLTFDDNGAVVLSALSYTTGYIDFLSGSFGSLDVTGYVQADYENLWNQGLLRFEGENSGMFADHFSVTGSVLTRTLDADTDGMPDAWEEQYFTNGIAALPGENADGDAQNNLEEYISGMDPTNAASFFRIVDEKMEKGSGWAIIWADVVPERWYRVGWTPTLTNTFTELQDHIEFPQNSYTDSVHHVDGQGFYKVDVRLK